MLVLFSLARVGIECRWRQSTRRGRPLLGQGQPLPTNEHLEDDGVTVSTDSMGYRGHTVLFVLISPGLVFSLQEGFFPSVSVKGNLN